MIVTNAIVQRDCEMKLVCMQWNDYDQKGKKLPNKRKNTKVILLTVN